MGAAADAGASAAPRSSSMPPNVTLSLPPKASGLERVSGIRWLSVPCTAAPAHLGRGPADSGRPTCRGWAERARGLLRSPPGGPREGRGVSSSSRPGGGEGEETAGGGAWAPGKLLPSSDPGPPSCRGGGTSRTLGRGARVGVADSARDWAGPGRRPHPCLGPRVGGRKSGSGGLMGLVFPASGFPSANEVLGATEVGTACFGLSTWRSVLSNCSFCYLHSAKCQSCHRLAVEQRVSALHRASVSPLFAPVCTQWLWGLFSLGSRMSDILPGEWAVDAGMASPQHILYAGRPTEVNPSKKGPEIHRDKGRRRSLS